MHSPAILVIDPPFFCSSATKNAALGSVQKGVAADVQSPNWIANHPVEDVATCFSFFKLVVKAPS